MAKDETARSEWLFFDSIVAGFVLSGLFLCLICIPLAWFSASMIGKDPVAAILLLQSEPDILAMLAKPSLGDFGYGDISVLAALLGFYGLLGLAIPLVFHVARRDGYLKLLTLTLGMTIGLSITLGWFEWSTTGHLDLFRPSAPKIFYLYLAFLVAEAAKLIIEHKELQAIPYTYLIDGLFGTVVVLIIQAGYDLALESLLLGPFFLIAVAVAIFLGEWLFLRPATIFSVGFARLLLDRSFERRLSATPERGLARLGIVRRSLFARIRKARTLSYAERATLLTETSAKFFRKVGIRPPRDAFAPRLDWRIAAPTFAINLLFPLFMAALGWLLF